MKKILLLFFVSILNLTLMAQDTTNVSWPVDTGSTSSPGEIEAPTGYKYDLKSVKDGSGGSYIVWANTTWQDTTYHGVVYVQHLNALGKPTWTNPVKVADSWRMQNNPRIVYDRAGGVIVAWNEYVFSQSGNDDTYNVYAQRINSAGARLWGNTGTVVTNAAGYQYLWNLEEYGTNGAVVSWDGSGSYFAVLEANGQLSNPIQVHASHDSYVEKVFPQVGGGFSVVYYLETELTDSTELNEAYFQRFDANGLALFSNGGIKFATGYEDGPDIEIYDLVSDGSGGIYYLTLNYDNNQLFLQHITSNGTFTFGPEYGTLLSSSAIERASLVQVSTGGVIVLWLKEVATQTLAKGFAATSAVKPPYGLFAQQISSNGTKLWGENGVTVKASGVSDQSDWQGIIDGTGNLLIVYPGTSNNGHSLYAQKISPTGSLLWPTNGILIDEGGVERSDVAITLVDNKLIVLWGENETMSGSTDLFSNIVNPDGTTLPITLDEFNAALNSSDVVLTWKTLSEVNNDYFEVLRSDDGSLFASVAKVKGRGTSSVGNSYTFTDVNPAATGKYLYYRLKQVDNDGTASYSSIEKIELPNLATAISIYPNPVSNAININGGINKSFTLRLSDINGREVFGKVQGVGVAQFDISYLPAGTYIAELQFGTEKVSKKIVKL